MLRATVAPWFGGFGDVGPEGVGSVRCLVSLTPSALLHLATLIQNPSALLTLARCTAECHTRSPSPSNTVPLFAGSFVLSPRSCSVGWLLSLLPVPTSCRTSSAHLSQCPRHRPRDSHPPPSAPHRFESSGFNGGLGVRFRLFRVKRLRALRLHVQAAGCFGFLASRACTPSGLNDF